MNIERRLRALAGKILSAPVTLYFSGGSAQTICGHGDFVLRLFQGVFGGADLRIGQASQLDMIRRSVSSTESGGGRMIELLRVLLDAREQNALSDFAEV